MRTARATIERAGRGESSAVNVHGAERLASTVLGGALVARGLARRSLGGVAMALAGSELLRRGIGGHCYLYQMLGISTAGSGRREAGVRADAPEVERIITVGKPAEELYRVWREPASLPRIMGHFAEVTPVGEDRTHWLVRGPFGRRLEWDTQVTEARPGESLRWQSLPGARVPNEGSVSFRPAPQDRGTEVTLRFRFDPPGGPLGDLAARFRGGAAPDALGSTALRRFKSLVEAGEIPTIEHQPAARKGGRDD